MKKYFKFEFYRVVMPSCSTIQFEDLIDKTSRLPLSQRILKIVDRPVYLYEIFEEYVDVKLSESNIKKFRFLTGMMIRVKSDDLPNWVNQEGVLNPLENNEKNLGLGEKSVFLYNPESRVFIFQRTQSGPSLNSIFDYFTEICSLEYPISKSVCLNEEAMSRIDKLKRVSKFEIKIASLDSMEIFKDQSRDSNEINKLRQESRAPFLKLTLSVEHQSTSLDIGFVVNAVKTWLPFTNSSSGIKTDTMLLAGSTEEEGGFEMDLIEDKMNESVSVKYEKIYNIRVVPDSERYIALRTAWKKRQESILKMYIHPSFSERIYD